MQSTIQKIMAFARENGLDREVIHHLKPFQRVKYLARHYGLGKHMPCLKKDVSIKFLREFFALEEQTSETFQELFDAYVHRHLLNKKVPLELDAHTITICNLPASKFYQTPEWRELRYKILEDRGNKCEACGRGPRNGVIVHVDHILPRSVFPEKALVHENMQILCEDCNIGKSNKYTKDWRQA